MQRLRAGPTAWAAFAALLGLLAARPADAQVGGDIAGLVRDEAGTPQLGAVVELLTADGRVAQTLESDYRGWFQFTGLFPGTYSLRVRQANFSPARKSELAVEPGERQLLDVCLRGVFASLQLAYGSQVRDMSERWKWALRAQHSRRNVLRLAPTGPSEQEEFLRKLSGTFEDTRAYAEFSAGQGNRPHGVRSQQDLGTAFAVATSLFGNHGLTLSGNRGGGSPTAAGGSTAFRTSYSKEVGLAKPEVALTVRQLQASSAAARGIFGAEPNDWATPRLETLSLEFADAVQLTDALRVEYGVLYESVKFVDRLHYASPYGKAVYELAPGRELAFSYASGVPPTAARARAGEDAALRSSVRQLGLFPRVAMAHGRPTVQRSEHAEVAYRERFGNSMIEAAVYRDSIRDAAVAAAVPSGVYADGNIVPDLYASSATLNGGHYQAPGVRVSYARKIRERLQAALGYGYAGVLAPSTSSLATDRAQDLRGALASRRAHLLLAAVQAELPGARTHVTGSYQWSSRISALPADPFNDFAARSEPGLNLVLRQPLPSVGGMPGRFEASAEFRNILKTGYIPLHLPDGRILNLLQAIRTYSGALSYIF